MQRSSLKFIFCFSFLSLLTATAIASDTLYFVGHIIITKKISYKYNLRFTIDDGKVTGYSLSDPGGINETKTKIFGNYDSVNKVINYEEKNVLRSSVDLKKNDLCFVKATLKFKKTKLLEMLSGKFTGIEPGKTEPCANGQIKLINTDRYKVIMKQINNADESPDTIAPAKNKSKYPVVKIDDEKGREFLITGSTVKLTIWDNGQVDGDKISILLNGKYVLSDYTIAAGGKFMDITLSGNEMDTVQVIALNEGTLPPNTAAIQIATNSEKYQILTQAKINEVRTIYLRRKLHQ